MAHLRSESSVDRTILMMALRIEWLPGPHRVKTDAGRVKHVRQSKEGHRFLRPGGDELKTGPVVDTCNTDKSLSKCQLL